EDVAVAGEVEGAAAPVAERSAGLLDDRDERAPVVGAQAAVDDQVGAAAREEAVGAAVAAPARPRDLAAQRAKARLGGERVRRRAVEDGVGEGGARRACARARRRGGSRVLAPPSSARRARWL